MQLTKQALDIINSRQSFNRTLNLLAAALDVSEATVRRYVSDNDDNLTKAAALKVIREQTGLTDAEILEETASEIVR